jgi:23S rRNA pseudouridine2604 synthase
MCEYFGYRVEKLERVRIMNITLGDLEVGQYREVTPEEYEKLMKLTKSSSSAPIDYKNRPHKIYRTGI